jgi:hypothetical protein
MSLSIKRDNVIKETDYVDEFPSFEVALKYITDNYGEVEKLAVY